MTTTNDTRFGFAKLIVDDEEKLATYYEEVYGLGVVNRVEGEAGGLGEPFREIMLGRNGELTPNESLVLFKFVDRATPRDQESILGFISEDLDALANRITDNGGSLNGPIQSMPEHGVRVLFATDPEGHLSENVELIPTENTE
ncbi:MAG: VOC family protein [bacterium]|nr:VOC family protein [bacterium]